MNEMNNTSELKKFVKENNLMDSNSNITFNAKIEIETDNNQIETETEVMIRFDGYNSAGKLTIIDHNHNINPKKFPEDFEAKWQNFKYNGNNHLKIKGNHPSPAIGKYNVSVTPL